MRWMLDTDTCIELIRSKTPALVENLLAHQVGEVGVSAITVAELEHGVERSDRREQNRGLSSNSCCRLSSPISMPPPRDVSAPCVPSTQGGDS